MQIAAVLAQSPEPVRRYIEETGLPFDILIDERRDTLRAFGVWHRLGIDAWNIARPAAFLISADGTITYAFIGDNQREFPEVSELLAAADAGACRTSEDQKIRSDS